MRRLSGSSLAPPGRANRTPAATPRSLVVPPALSDAEAAPLLARHHEIAADQLARRIGVGDATLAKRNEQLGGGRLAPEPVAHLPAAERLRLSGGRFEIEGLQILRGKLEKRFRRRRPRAMPPAASPRATRTARARRPRSAGPRRRRSCVGGARAPGRTRAAAPGSRAAPPPRASPRPPLARRTAADRPCRPGRPTRHPSPPPDSREAPGLAAPRTVPAALAARASGRRDRRARRAGGPARREPRAPVAGESSRYATGSG